MLLPILILLPLQGISCDAPVDLSIQVPGCGLIGEVEGHTVVVGTAELLASRGVADRDGRVARAVAEWGKRGALGRSCIAFIVRSAF